jgi:putative phosphoribosyl transferase
MALSTNNKDECVEIPCGGHCLMGILKVPTRARGVVAFAHGSGSERLSPRSQFVAGVLERAGLATLLLDLLEEEEAEDQAMVFDIDLLARRLEGVAELLRREVRTCDLRLGYFGASTGAAAALVAAAQRPCDVGAVVSRGGRPDLALEQLSAVQAPTLLIVGGNDDVVVDLNEQAFDALRCPKRLVVVPGATHLFEEPGALDAVARLAKEWFLKYLAPACVSARNR